MDGDGGIEILVHTAAPSRSSDDAHYRALARDYLDFDPVKRLRLSEDPQKDTPQAVDRDAEGQLQEELFQSTPKIHQTNTIQRNDPDDDYQESQESSLGQSKIYLTRSQFMRTPRSPQRSFNSVLDNLDTPIVQGLPPRTPHSPTVNSREGPALCQSDSWKTPPSVIPDSQSPYSRAIPAFSSPTRILEFYIQQQDDSSGAPSSLVTTHIGDHDHEHERYHSIQQGLPNSPKECGPSDPLESPERAEVNPSKEVSSSPPRLPGLAPIPFGAMQARTPTATNIPAESFRERAGDTTSSSAVEHELRCTARNCNNSSSSAYPVARAKKRSHAESGQETTASLSPTTSDVEPHSSTSSSQHMLKRQRVQSPVEETRHMTNEGTETADGSEDRIDRILEATEGHLVICPPLPETSLGDLPRSFLTELLQRLAGDLSLQSRFEAKHRRSRDLRPRERGYWSIDCRGWDANLKQEAWAFLESYVGEGRAGWGIWATRDMERETLNLYCWGEVVGHAYLMLYLVSFRRVKGTGARWLDGDGQTVIAMAD